ncbi:CHASE2 domain-containing protein [Fundidesulfovibrio terrae]|uniref:CHASE2 domain-containing protein n=1 Tax=Fundidesulfovibrio terrae TaxID=2922866 RepID=UPI001FAFC5B7|nr:adenylate/guanylate cyclase domain-containing protein [Fundidesulfovibrio terrae]
MSRIADLRLWLTLFLPGLAVTAAMSFAHWTQPAWLVFLDYKVYDVLLSKRPRHEPSGRVAVVDLDEKSLAEVGQWPWPRYQIAVLLGRLKQYGVLAAGMDVVFAEPDQTSPERIRRKLSGLGVDMDFTGLPPALRDNDALLASNLSGGPYVLGYFFTFSAQDAAGSPGSTGAGGPCALPPPRLALKRSPGAVDAPLMIAQAASPVCPLPELSQACGWAGFFNSVPDRDNIVRWVPLAISWKGAPYPSLAVSTIMRAFGDKSAVLSVSPNPYGGQDMTLSLDLGEQGRRSVPLDRHGRVLLDYRGPGRTFPYISAADVMAGRVPREALEGKIVFIGTTARGLQDVRATPLDQSFPGVEAHATVADMVLSDTFLRRPLDAWYLELALLGVFGLGVTVQLMFTRSLWVGALSLLAGLGMWQGSSYAMDHLDLYVSPLSPLLALGLNFTLITFLKFLREERKRRFLHSAFNHYLSPQVVSQLVAQPEKLNLSGEEKEVSILFSDVRGFTTISEKLTPTQVVDLLHEYLTPMTRLVTANSGTLDKFIGDAVMAFWNAPADVEDHPRLAVETALAMLNELDRLNAGFKERFGFEIQIGIGLNLGAVRVGNFGSEDLFDYTIIGDNVNLGSRLEGLTKYYHQRLLVSGAMRERAGAGFAWQEVDRVLVKGKHEPVSIHTVNAQAAPGELDGWSQGLTLYREGRFQEALAIFEGLQAATANGLYELYAGRCRALAANPPGPDWSGVFEHTTK